MIEALGGHVERMGVAPQMVDLVPVQAIIHEYEICQHLADVFEQNWDQISPTLQPIVQAGRKITVAQYEDAMAVKASAEEFFAKFFNDFDAILAPSATGEAPRLGNGTGDPVFCTIWTLGGTAVRHHADVGGRHRPADWCTADRKVRRRRPAAAHRSLGPQHAAGCRLSAGKGTPMNPLTVPSRSLSVPSASA